MVARMVPEGASHPSRRKFLAIASVAAASGAGAGLWWYRQQTDGVAKIATRPMVAATRKPVAPDGKASEPVTYNQAAVTNREYEAYVQNLHTDFQVTTDGETAVSIRLKEVGKLLRQNVNGTRHDSFALYFDGPAEHPIAEMIHRFHHERLGDLEFFLSSYGKPGKTISYQAYFDRAV